jgi:hypothetical protein
MDFFKNHDIGRCIALDKALARAMTDQAMRLEEQARAFLAMGYELEELTVFCDARQARWHRDVVPLSALAEHEREDGSASSA